MDKGKDYIIILGTKLWTLQGDGILIQSIRSDDTQTLSNHGHMLCVRPMGTWTNGNVKKAAKIALVTKVRAILLMEVDNYFHNNPIFGNRMMGLARTNKISPEDIYSKKGNTVTDAILQQVLTYDLAKQ